jgi:hypothetical protein
VGHGHGWGSRSGQGCGSPVQRADDADGNEDWGSGSSTGRGGEEQRRADRGHLQGSDSKALVDTGAATKPRNAVAAHAKPDVSQEEAWAPSGTARAMRGALQTANGRLVGWPTTRLPWLLQRKRKPGSALAEGPLLVGFSSRSPKTKRFEEDERTNSSLQEDIAVRARWYQAQHARAAARPRQQRKSQRKPQQPYTKCPPWPYLMTGEELAIQFRRCPARLSQDQSAPGRMADLRAHLRSV